MALLANVMRFRIGLALSALGLAVAVVGIYWDPMNGRELAAEGLGLMQTLVTAGGAVFCLLGAVIMVMPRKEPPAARAERPITRSTAERDSQRPKKKNRSAGGRRRRNRIKR